MFSSKIFRAESFEVEDENNTQEFQYGENITPSKEIPYFYYGYQGVVCLMLSIMAIMSSIFYLEIANLEILTGPPSGSVLGDPDLAVFVSVAQLARNQTTGLQTANLAQTSGLQTVLMFNIILPMAVAIGAIAIFPKARASKNDFKNLPKERLYVWGIDLVVLAIFIVAGSTAVRSDAFQKERLAYCFFVFVMNTILLWLVVLINKIDTFSDPADKDVNIFRQQVFLVINNTIWTMGSLMLTNYPGLNPDPMDPWFGGSGFTGLGAETFVFFWLSFVTSAGLKLFVFSPTTFVVSKFNSKYGEKVTSSQLYGSEELWASLLLNFAYLNVFAWLNNFSFIIGVGASILFFLFGIIRNLCLPNYKPPPSYIPYCIPNVLAMIPMLTLIFYFVVLLPRDSEYTVVCVACLLTYITLGFVYLIVYFKDMISSYFSSETSETEKAVSLP